jgi:hypothetical protein
MMCYRCNRHIKRAYMVSGGQVFGPTCGAILGLVPDVQQATKTQQRAVKRKSRKQPLHDWRAVVQDGQKKLFEGLTA